MEEEKKKSKLKIIIPIILAIVGIIIVGIVVSGRNKITSEDIDNIIWLCDDDRKYLQTYNFTDGKDYTYGMASYTDYEKGGMLELSGTYEIKKNKIVLTCEQFEDKDKKLTLYCKYDEKGELYLQSQTQDGTDLTFKNKTDLFY